MNLKKRIISAIVFFVVIVFGLINRWTFLAVFLLMMIVQLYEFISFAHKRGYKPLTSAIYLLGVVSFVEFFLIAQKSAQLNIVLLIIGGIFLVFVVELFRKLTTPIENIAVTILALIYVALPFSLLNFIVFSPRSNYQFDYRLLFVFLLLIWATDIGAYFIGIKLGRHPLFRKISPKKTVEGTIGGVVSAFVLALVLAKFLTFFTYTDAIVFAFIVTFFGTIGDLVESMFKRQIDIKDSGNIMPGHGGLLDRFDSTLISAPFVVLYLYW